MGKSRYNKATELLKPIVGETIGVNKIWRRIMIEVGSDDRTIREMMELMIKLGMIREVDQNYYLVIKDKANI